MLEKVITLLKDQSITIPKLLLTSYKELKLTDLEFIFITYLLNSNRVLDPKKISNELGLELPQVLELVSSLEDKDILKIETFQNKNIREEKLTFDGLYQKLAFLVVNEKIENKEEINLFDLFEREFGRTLSPMEYEIIGGWKEVDFKDELIVLGLKEAIYNGVTNLRYIDKILYEWKKKGIKTSEDVNREKKEFIETKKKNPNQDLYEYDWLNE